MRDNLRVLLIADYIERRIVDSCRAWHHITNREDLT